MPFVLANITRVQYLATVALFSLGWLLHVIGTGILNGNGAGHGTLIWYLFYHLFVLIGFVGLLGFDLVQPHRMALVGFFAIGFTYASTVLELIYINTNGTNCTSAGDIFIAISYVIWIVLVGSDRESNIHSLSGMQVVIPNRNTQQQPAAAPLTQDYNKPDAQQQPVVVDGDNLPTKARALYNYSANPEDPNELSFSKGDIFDVLDNKGKWWHCRLTKGDQVVTGIAPSNYLQPI